MDNIDNVCVNAIRMLSVDAIQKANSGHPGMPLGSAPIAYELWAHQMKHNGKNPAKSVLTLLRALARLSRAVL